MKHKYLRSILSIILSICITILFVAVIKTHGYIQNYLSGVQFGLLIGEFVLLIETIIESE